MPTVNELFSDTVDKTLIIDWDTKTIKIPSSITNIGVESDDETTILDFKMPRYKGKIDLKGYVVRINYHNANGEGDVYTAKDVAVDDEFITFSWEVGRFAVMYKGDVKFIVCAKKFASDGITVDKECNTTTAILPCLVGLETEQAVVESYPDAIASAAYETILLALDSDLKGEPGYTPVKGTDYYTPEEREEFLNDVVLGAKALYANAFTNEVSGEVIQVGDVSPIEHSPEVRIRGKNLCDGILTSGLFADAAFNYYPQGVFKSIKAYLKAGTYTISFGVNTNVVRTIIDGFYKIVGKGWTGSSSYTFTTKTDGYVGFSFRDSISANTEWLDTTPIQIEEGTVVTEYEPYIDPTTVTLTRCGKNLLPLNNFTYTPNTTTYTVENGVLNINGYIVARRVSATGLIGKKLTISCESSRSGDKGGGLAVEFRDATNTRLSSVYYQNEISATFSFTIPEGTNMLAVFFYASGSAETIGTATYRKIQLELGDSVTEYEPYKGETYTPNADGTVDISTVSPIMTLMTDLSGITIDCKYGRDTNLVMGDIQNALTELHNYAQGVVAGGVSV